MSPTQRILSLAFLSQGVVAGLYPGLSFLNHTCNLVEPVLSCSEKAQPGLVDTCCAETYGGLIFWNTYTGLEHEGQLLPKDSWTIHGLWPDFCNGSYTQYCDLKRQYDPEPSPNTTTGTPAGKPVKPWKGEPISNYVKRAGKFDLLEYMQKFWTGLNQPSWYLWAHEFSKHATCFSSFDIECYGLSYLLSPHEEVVDFFGTVIAYYQKVPTWRFLSAAGITPSNTTSYSLSDFQAALQAGFGKLPYIGCSGPRYNETAQGRGSRDNGYTVISEMWYYYHVRGRVQHVDGVPVDANSTGGRLSSCATTPGALWYYERNPGSVA
ncbi:ribonuclease T2 [Xylariaceae sp. FL0594]|nr:ribonuclease T2 [Xylariaceae sp. FL0594]